ncbi:Rne/Rng family ribonuclease [Qipengyuania atrilutea]|uniref:Ribonuclease E n=1 Tax=Qipengyuania atrilutea TaxID=2744473 RepID=A0A850H080_9SPHN|nr:ribonuclease E/G [Actirhodobacter atriluteus]NVD43910.1 Rne/Rng family ribonuclease [Actirhodobacter atriluteus]
MATRMLIDARHPEETRVAVLKGNRIEEFDFESAEHKQIKGNIYLAKVTRVEPSLQAAFVDFGGNRHGFLAFSEIHPDYYQIPHDDRLALLEEEAAAAEEEARLRAEEEDEGHSPGEEYDAEDESAEALAEEFAEDGVEEIDTSEKDKVSTIEEGHLDSDDDDDDDDDDQDDEDGSSSSRRGRRPRRGRGGKPQKNGKAQARAKAVDAVRERRQALRRRYKIQDVIQRRQVLLVQVVKEERGNKGAALTTYLSLAGRYTVLMPNSNHGGGISRKINSSSDRKRLKQIVSDLSLPRSMGLIVRTAGLSRTKPEIKRDFDYLARLWDEIRERTLGSTAPALIHSDSDLIKRAIRDIYNRDIEEVIVEGEEGYKSAKAFMKLLMPSHARRVKAYSDPVPLFQRYGAEDQLKAMYDPVVQLKSGGYLVINPTEALVSIDINSGRSTKEHGIEQTALSTNLEAAQEIARQLRLRDMAGLVVIDFIDMERHGNIRKVERCMKDSLKNDRARIQVGRISGFGLMEMSRQRLRTGVLEASTRDCPHCDGTGLVRTASSAGLSALRLIEEEAAKGKGTNITLSASTEAAIYLLNAKRADLQEIERRYGVNVEVVPEGEDEGAKMSVASSGPKPTDAPKFEAIVDDDPEDDEIEDDFDDTDERDDSDEDDNDQNGRRRRRRRGGRGRNKNRSDEGGENDTQNSRSDSNSDDENGENKPKRRRRRGGRGRKKNGQNGEQQKSDQNEIDATEMKEVADQMQDDIAVVSGPDGAAETAEEMADKSEEGKAPAKKPRKPRRTKAQIEADKAAEADASARDCSADSEEKPAESEKKPRRARKKAEPKPKANAKPSSEQLKDDSAGVSGPDDAKQTADAQAANDASNDEKAAPARGGRKAKAGSDESAGTVETAKPRKGWWQRTFGE